MSDGPVARIVKKSEFAGEGCVLQALGLLSPVVGGFLLGTTGVVLGLIAMLALVGYGSYKSMKYICGNCRNPLASKEVRICPTCHAQLSR